MKSLKLPNWKRSGVFGAAAKSTKFAYEILIKILRASKRVMELKEKKSQMVTGL